MSEALDRLARDWFVSLETNNLPGVWTLTITRRAGGYYALTYRGDLSEVIARAQSGDDPDDRSR